MMDKLKEKLRSRQGFTLMEMMLVIAITAVLTGLVTAGIYGYLVTAYMTRVNDTAKTVFLAAQNYLTEQKQLGKLTEFNKTAEAYGAILTEDDLKKIFLENDSSFDFNAYKEKYSTDTVRYILLEEGDGLTESTNPVYTIVHTYLNDTDILSHTFFIEYDTRTGVVRSVFYTEKSGTLSYLGGYDEKSNVIIRDGESLREKRQGFYGVDSTSLVKTDIDLYAPANVILVNGERLYAEWKEVNYLSPKDIDDGYVVNANEAFDNAELRDYLVYDVAVYRNADDGEELLFTISGIKPGMAKGETLAKADTAGGDGVLLTYNSKTNTYQLLLDDIDHSIYDTYGAEGEDSNIEVSAAVQAEDMIYCRVSERLADHGRYEGESDPVSTNLQSVNFAGGADEYSYTGLDTDLVTVYGNGNLLEDGSAEDYGKAFSVANARHLNNMRYAVGISCFIQTSDIDWAKPKADRPAVNTYFEPLTFSSGKTAAGGMAAAETAFAGTFKNGYQDGDDYVISHLNIDELSGTSPKKNVGMFRQNMGKIIGLHIKDSTVKGAYLTGIVAGSSSGSITGAVIEDCTVKAAYYAGGLTGYNYPAGSLMNCSVDADVSAVVEHDTNIEKKPADTMEQIEYGWYIGGIAGVNQGSVSGITTGKKTVTGTSYVGGLFGANRAKAAHRVENSVNENTVAAVLKNGNPAADTGYQDFGGITGFNGEESVIEYCTSKTLVFLEKGAADPEYIKNIGGIAGRNAGTLAACVYTEAARQQTSVKTFTNECLTSAEKGSLPVYSGVNVGGITGRNEETGIVTACGSSNAVMGYCNVGGIAGSNAGQLKYKDHVLGEWTQVSEENRKITGVIIASDVSAGGVAGTNEQEKLKDYQNHANIFAGSLAGGITGVNGGIGTYVESDKTDTDYYNKLLNPSFEEQNKDMVIDSCANYGFVYALNRYAGGITGMNSGTIKGSNSTVDLSENEYLKDKTSDALEKIAHADCVGGIAGLNTGKITGNMVSFATRAGVCGYDFVGGVAGLNAGVIENIQKVTGEVWAQGRCVGGIVGLNMNADSMTKIAIADSMKIQGGYFVGGIIGMNVAQETDKTQITGLVTQASEGRGSVRGTAYVGGILGYNTTFGTDGDLSELFDGEIKKLIEEAFAHYEIQKAKETQGKSATIFQECINNSEVYADRYLGGIVGYNGEESPLYVINSINYGQIAVENEDKTTDGYYFIGGITGRNSAGGVIHGCINDGSVKSPSIYLGGICEVNEGYIQFCTVGNSQNYNSVGITGDNSVGGLVGLNSNYIVQCSSSQYAKISGGNNTGGIAGTNDIHGIITGDASKAKEISGITASVSSEGRECISAGTVVGKNHTGGVVGLNQGQVEMVSVSSTASIAGNVYVGGFIGSNEGTITKNGESGDKKVIRDLVNHAGTVVGKDEVGGIVGKHNATRIENCQNYGNIQIETGSQGKAGGITGSVAEGITIADCANYGTVTGNDAGASAGGITGENRGTVTDCVHYGLAVSNESQAGGIAGNNKGIVGNSSNYGSVQGALTAGDAVAVGGIAGINEKGGSVLNCSSKSNDLGTNSITGVSVVGGIIGYNQGILQNDTEESLLVTVSIKTADQKVARPSASSQCRIGGVVGRTGTDSGQVLKNYRYAGVIQVTEKGASDNQSVGGIVGELESSITLENCLLEGRILGLGNGSDTGIDGGVGGLAGVSRGVIVVYSNDDGIYTSGTEVSVVEGNRNVGGLVGKTEAGHTLQLKTAAEGAVKLEELQVNTNTAETDDLYYTNLSTVSGGIRVGGCYGYLYQYGESDGKSGRDTAVISHYRNGYLKGGTVVGGTVKPNTQVTSERQAIGGVFGSNRESNIFYQASELYNYGTVGSSSIDTYDTSGKTVNVGGIFGYCGGSRGIAFTNIYNYGRISCGQEYAGGLLGKVELVTNASNSENALTDSINYGEIITKAKYTGGLIGGVYRIAISGVENLGAVTAYGDAAYIGGILGTVFKPAGTGNAWVPKVSVSDSKNAAAIEMPAPPNAIKDGRIGGIAGYLTGNSELKNCENQGTLSCLNAKRCGGIAGFVEGTQTVIEACKNGGDILLSAQDCGGITGEFGAVTQLTFLNNENQGQVSAKYRSGGLIGTINVNTVQSAAWTIKNSTNYGTLYPALNGYTGNQQAHEHGGCIGYLKSRAVIEGFTNEGSIIFDSSKSGKTISNIVDIGGIAGVMEGHNGSEESGLYNCVNRGTIAAAAGQSKMFHLNDIGGIVGKITASGNTRAVVRSCQNQTEINLSNYNYSDKNVNRVGGIAGYVTGNAKLLYCVNQSGVITSTDNGSNVGGVAGESTGLIYSCQTENAAGAVNGCVTGKEAVGGIIGYANGITCKLGSIANEDNTDVMLNQNAFDVSGMRMVGGIAGRQSAATIMSAVNCENVTVTLLGSKTGADKANSAGGIVGLAEKATQQGVIVNCYNFGEVRFEQPGSTRYLGGVVGYRERLTDSKTAAAVKDSFYLHDDTNFAHIDKSQPDTSKGKQVLAVGNEPEGAYVQDAQDQMSGTSLSEKKDTQERFLWNEEAYKQMYWQLHGAEPIDSSGWSDMEQVISDILKKYDKYKLPVPETGGVTALEHFDYTLAIDKMPGFCESVKLYLFDGTLLDEEIETEGTGALALLFQEEEVTMDGQLESMTFSVRNLTSYIGKSVKVAIQATGVKETLEDGTEVVYTTDSDLKVVEEFIMMPPLVTPEIEMTGQEGAVVTFRIKNWDAYQASASAIYPAIAENPQIRDLEIYQQLLKGLEYFSITDYYREKENGTAKDVKDVWNIRQEDIDADTGTFTIDYAASPVNFETYRSKRQYHIWEVKAIARHSDWSVETSEVETGNLYRYTTSEIGNCKFRIQAEVPLNPPENLKAAYIGGMDAVNEAQTPAYEIIFDRSASPQDAIGYYLITVTNPANGRTHTFQYIPDPVEETPDQDVPDGSGGDGTDTEIPVCSYTLTKEVLLGAGENQLEIDLLPESQPAQLTYTVQTVKNDSDAAKYFINSENTADTIPLVKKGYPVEKAITIAVENPSTPNIWTYQWTDTQHGSGNDTYLVSYRILDGENVLHQTTEEISGHNYYQLDVSGYQSTYQIEFSVVRKGLESGGTVTRLHSDPVIHTKFIGEKMAAVENVQTVFSGIDGENLVYKVDFEIPGGLTAQNCKEFVLKQVTIESPATVLGELTIPFDAEHPVEIRIPISGNAGKNFYTIITARSALDASAGAEEAQGNVVKIPTDQLSPPSDIKMGVLVIETDGSGSIRYEYELTENPIPGVYSFLEEEFAGMTYQMSWSLADTVNMKNQHMELLVPSSDPSGEPVVIWEADTSQAATAFSLTQDLTAYAGQTLLLRINNLPEETALMLPSETEEVLIYVPKLRLKAPEFAEGTPEAPSEPVIIQKEDGTAVAPNEEVTAEAFAKLSYQVTWTKPEGTGHETGVKLRLVYEEPDADGNLVETPVVYQRKCADGMAVASEADGTMLIPWDEIAGPTAESKTTVLQGIDPAYAGKALKVYVSHMAGALTPDMEDDPVWTDSTEAETIVTVPLLKNDIP